MHAQAHARGPKQEHTHTLYAHMYACSCIACKCALLRAGKMVVLDGLLDAIVAAGDRVAIVSTSTGALDCIDELLVQPKG